MKPLENHYDFTVIGRWRNRDNVAKVVEAIRDAGNTCFSFIENDWSHLKSFNFSSKQADADKMMKQTETLSLDSSELKEIFERDMDGLKNSEKIVLVLPAGTSSHIEAGVAYGLGKPLYAVAGGGVEVKTESLYLIFDEIFPSVDEFKKFLEKGGK